MNRRSVLLGAGGAAGLAAMETAVAAPTGKRDGFLWGTSGAAYQIEGGNVASDLWVLEHVKPTIFLTPSGDACDAYHRYEEDLALAARLGFNAHRLSIEWSRIEPERGQFSGAALAYYRGVLETCRKLGLAPVVTFNHFTVPRWVAASGGFNDPANVAAFAAYCARLTQAMGDLIHIAATFNEPNLATIVKWGGLAEKYRPLIQAMQKAAGERNGAPGWTSPMVSGESQYAGILAAHAAALESVRAAGGRFPVGVTLAVTADRPADNDAGGMNRKNGEMLDRWLAAPGDFIGVQSYTGSLVGPEKDVPPGPGEELTQMGYAFMPDAVEHAVRLVAARTRKPIYVTENGVATEDDKRRVAYIRVAVAGVERCRADGIDLRGYIHWSLLDNWEWMSGYKPKFGLVAVDRKTFKRTPKPSARFLGEIARRGGLR
ncbi:MAG TPA: family 1 glycosylhydrolase [Sphingomonas sp.]|nr:family 1 glycosylhydrolase [Sphingomonas sp.]